uniref:Peptidase A1 domain-containing protein n=1 Tax=Rhabditophanes sp. KR3021 TaxID=114890 RepID=A0AC35U9E4_9BILA
MHYLKLKKERQHQRFRRSNEQFHYQDISDYDDCEFVANITIGNEETHFKVVLDTGSANLWVPEISCLKNDRRRKRSLLPYPYNECPDYCISSAITLSACIMLCPVDCCKFAKHDPSPKSKPNFDSDSTSACVTKNKFDPYRSLTFKKIPRSFSVSYGTGDCSGYYGVDTVRMGDIGIQDRLTIPNTYFGLATHVGDFFATDPVDGIFGLSLQSQQGVPTPLVHAAQIGVLKPEPIFTIYLQGLGQMGYKDRAGRFTYGGLDEEHCDPVETWVALTSTRFWQFQIHEVKFGEVNVKDMWETISDSGTSFVLGPQGVTDEIAKQIGAVFDPLLENYYFPCEKEFDGLDITIGSHKYHITRRNLMIKDHKGRCALAICPKGAGFGPTWVLGIPFLKEYCNVHDIGKKLLGFARVKTF